MVATDQEVEKLYLKTEPLLKKIAGISTRKYRLEYNRYYNDIESVARFSFLKAVKYYDGDKGAKFNSFVTYIAKNDIDEYVNKQIFKHTSNITFAELDENTVLDRRQIVTHKSDIERFVEDLASDERAYLSLGSKALLMSIDGFSCYEIAQILDTNEATIRSYISRTKEYIREHYNN